MSQCSIERLSQLDTARVDVLRRAYITSVENLLGQLEADPEALGELLDLDRAALEKLGAEARNLLSPEIRREFARQGNKRYSYGALNPPKG